MLADSEKTSLYIVSLITQFKGYRGLAITCAHKRGKNDMKPPSDVITAFE